jgi:ribosomal RNA-processing protein 12
LPAHPHLQATTLSLLSHLLSQSTSQNSLEAHKIPLLLLEILNTPPTDNSVIPSWLEVVENGMVSWSREDPSACSAEFGRVWSLVWGYLSGDSGKERGVGKAAERALVGMARYCITEEMMTAAIDEKIKVGGALGVLPAAPKSKGPGKKQIHPQDQKVSATSPILAQIIANLQTSLHALRALPFLPSTLTILSSLISRLRIRPSSVSTPTKASEYDPRMATAAQWLILDLVRDVGGLRIQKGFENKEKADEVLGMAIEVVGPEGVLEALPLNVEANR